jgi:hypothetical protein
MNLFWPKLKSIDPDLYQYYLFSFFHILGGFLGVASQCTAGQTVDGLDITRQLFFHVRTVITSDVTSYSDLFFVKENYYSARES